MKNLKFVLAFLVAAVLSSCLDTEEKITLNSDNSGTYSMTIDLGRMLKMAGSMGMDKEKGDSVKEKKDTTIFLKDLLSEADNLSPDEKALYIDGVINVNVDEVKSEMKITMSSPFKNTAGLTEIKNNFFAVMNKLKAFERATGDQPKPGEDGADDLKMGSKSANPVGDQFTFIAGNGKISSTVTNMEAFKAKVATDSSLTMMS